MGLDFRKRTGRIANGSRLIVDGQPTTGQKVSSPTFRFKVSAPKDNDLLEQILPFLTPTPTPTNTPTPTPTNTPTPTPTLQPSQTPTNTPTNTPTSTPTPTPSPNYDAYLPVELALQSPLTNTNCSVWYSYIVGPYNPTQPYPAGLTWTKLGSSQITSQCNSYTSFGQIGLLTGQSVYIQVRSGDDTLVFESSSLTNGVDPCVLPPATPYFTTSYSYGGGLITNSLKMRVNSPLNTAPAP